MAKLVKYLRRAAAQVTRRKNAPRHDPERERVNILGPKSDFYIREAYKTLRTNITFSLAVEGCKVIAVTSALASEGKSITVLNLALSFAETGRRVLLVDCDLRRPSIARLLDMNAKPGLSNVLVKFSSVEHAVRHTERYGLNVLLSGDIPPNPTELLGSDRMAAVIEALKSSYDYIFVDTPPVNVVADASILSNYMDGMLFVVRQGESEKDPVLSAVSQLEFASAKLLGFVLNGAGGDGASRYGYGKYKYKKYKYGYGKYKHGYGWGYGYSARPEEENAADGGDRP